MSKFLFLITSDLSDEDRKVVHNLGSVLEFTEINAPKTAGELFAMYDVIILDSNVYKTWYASYRNYIRTVPTMKSVYLYPKHTKINDDIQKKLKSDWLVDSVIKYLPVLFTGKADLIEKLLAGHLSSIDLPATSSCVKDVLIYIGQKLGCVSSQ